MSIKQAHGHEVLAVGDDPDLLKIRIAALRTRWEASSCSVEEALSFLASANVGVILLCHLIEPQQARLLVSSIKSHFPLVRIVALHLSGKPTLLSVDKVVDVSGGPTAWMAATSSLLQALPNATHKL